MAEGSSAVISLTSKGKDASGALEECCGNDALLSPPLPLPTPSRWDHGLMPALSVVLSYYLDEGIGLVMTSSFMIGPTWDGEDGLLPVAFPDLSYADIRWIYASYVACYAAIQFLVSPYTGALSDRVGRKPVLMVCMIGFFIATLIQALALQICQGTQNQSKAKAAVIALFISRIVRGFFGGQTGVVKAVMADAKQAHNLAVDEGQESSNKRKLNHANFFVYFGFTVGFGRLCGVILGTFGARDFSYSFVFWILTAVDALAAVYVRSPFSQETRIKPKEGERKGGKSRNPFKGLRFLLWDVWRLNSFSIPATLLVLFFFRIGWMLFANYLQVFLEGFSGRDYQESLLTVGSTWIYGSLLYLFLEFFVNQPLLKRKVSSAGIILTEFILQGSLLVAAPFVHTIGAWYGVVIPLIGLNAFGTPNIAALVAAAAPPNQSGKVLGSASAVKSFTYFFAAMLSGISIDPNLLWWVSAGCFYFASLLIVAFLLIGLLKDDYGHIEGGATESQEQENENIESTSMDAVDKHTVSIV